MSKGPKKKVEKNKVSKAPVKTKSKPGLKVKVLSKPKDDKKSAVKIKSKFDPAAGGGTKSADKPLGKGEIKKPTLLKAAKEGPKGKADVKSAPKGAANGTAKVLSKAPLKAPVKTASQKSTLSDAKAKGATKSEVLNKKKTPVAKGSEAQIKTKEEVKPSKKVKEDKASKKNKKKEEVGLEDDFIPDDDIDGSDEIGEYEEELKAVETMDLETEDEEDWSLETKPAGEEDIVLTDAEGNRYCRAKDCDQIANVETYCRYHYLLYWKRIQIRKKILADGKFERYVEELTSRFPDKFLEMIRRDLLTQKDFLSAIQELEIDEADSSAETEEDTQSFMDEVRGLGEATTGSLDDDEY